MCNLLILPTTTVRDRLYSLGIETYEIRKIWRGTRNYYTKAQYEALREYWLVNGHKYQPRKPKVPKIDYCLESNCIIIESKLNLIEL